MYGFSSRAGQHEVETGILGGRIGVISSMIGGNGVDVKSQEKLLNFLYFAALRL